MFSTHFAFTALGALAFLSQDLGFKVEADSIVAKRFEEATRWELETAELWVDGELVEQELPPVAGSTQRVVRITDEYEAVEEGRVTKLLREFVELDASSAWTFGEGAESARYSTRALSELEGALVRFVWNAEAGEYDAIVEEGARDEDVQGLEYDMDLLALLPDRAIEVGGTWSLDGADLARAFRPGGDLGLRIDDATEGSLFSVPSATVLAAGLVTPSEVLADAEGDVTAKLLGTEDVDGRRLARIRLEGGLEGRRDLSVLLRTAAEDNLTTPTDVADWSLVSTLECEFTGTLLFDLGAGRIDSLELTGDIVGEHELEWSETVFEGQVSTFRSVYETQGTLTVRVAVEHE
ncbi:MAG: hypothetical protein WD226_05385 [Planctomycetota bacterium]